MTRIVKQICLKPEIVDKLDDVIDFLKAKYPKEVKSMSSAISKLIELAFDRYIENPSDSELIQFLIDTKYKELKPRQMSIYEF